MEPAPVTARRLLFVSNLFPDRTAPVRGLDNATLLHALKPHWTGGIHVLSPRPTLIPGRAGRLEPQARDAALSPRYVASPYLPKIGSWCNDWLMRGALRRPFLESVESFAPDLALGSWLYPDGCALAELARERDLPLVLITQGTDTHQYLEHPVRRRKILEAIEASAAVICRSGDLARRLSGAGAPPDKLKVIYNGVDTNVFHPSCRSQACQELELKLDPSKLRLLFVGNLLPVKNVGFLLRAHAELNRRRSERKLEPVELVLVGEGPLCGELAGLTTQLGTSSWVRFAGRCSSEQVARWMNASEMLCLCSHNEGFPNVILEARACGLPIVATDVGGIGEKVGREFGGCLVEAGDLEAFTKAIEAQLDDGKSDRHSGDVEPILNWPAVATAYQAVFEEVLAQRAMPASG